MLRRRQRQHRQSKPLDMGETTPKRTLIVGAGSAGRALLAQIRDLGSFHIVGFVDDNAMLRNHTIEGHRVLGRTEELETIVRHKDVEQVVLCMPTASRSIIARIVRVCERCNTAVVTVPSLPEILSGKLDIDTLQLDFEFKYK